MIRVQNITCLMGEVGEGGESVSLNPGATPVVTIHRFTCKSWKGVEGLIKKQQPKKKKQPKNPKTKKKKQKPKATSNFNDILFEKYDEQ